MANQMENDSMTYEKLQELINLKLTHIEESHANERKIVNSNTMHLESPLNLLSSWLSSCQRLKGLIFSLFLLKDIFK